MSWWKHAFAVEPAGAMTPSAAQQAVVDAWCHRIVDRGLAMPAILFLESSKPLGPMAAQSLLFLQPWFELLLDRSQIQELTSFFEQRGSFDYLCQRLEEMSNADRSSRSISGKTGNANQELAEQLNSKSEGVCDAMPLHDASFNPIEPGAAADGIAPFSAAEGP